MATLPFCEKRKHNTVMKDKIKKQISSTQRKHMKEDNRKPTY